MSDLSLSADIEKKFGRASHERSRNGKDEWLTPPEIVSALGAFDLDPCSPVNRPWPTAATHFTIHDNGMRKPWAGRVWLNPPYGGETDRWMFRMADHGNGIALIFARTETATWQKWVFPFAAGILFIKGRIVFHHVSGKPGAASAGAPSALIAYGEENAAALERSGIHGVLTKGFISQ